MKRNLEYWLKRTQATAVRNALTGELTGIPIDKIIEVLGEEECVKRLENYDNLLKLEYQKKK